MEIDTQKAQTEDRLVAFLDILGFSHTISREENFENKFEQYIQIIEDTVKSIDSNIEYILSSDSIILTTTKNEESFIKFVNVLSTLSYKLLIDLNIPLKGCVTDGKISRFKRGNLGTIIAGQPIIEAYGYEQKQNWIGIMISPNTVKSFPVIKEYCDIQDILKRKNDIVAKLKKIKEDNYISLMISIQKYDNIPFKSYDKGFAGFVILPCEKDTYLNLTFISFCLWLYKDHITELMLYASNPDIQLKYENTNRFINEVFSNFDTLYNNEFFQKIFPEEVKVLKQALEKFININDKDKKNI